MQPLRDGSKWPLMPFEITSYYQLLDLARDRPGMYGIGGRSFRLLRSFLGGLSFSKLDPGDPPIWDFAWWSAVRTDHLDTNTLLRWLENEQPDEQAYDTWFGLLDEYRACRIVELTRLPGSVVRFREAWTSSEPGGKLEPYIPPTPQFIGSTDSRRRGFTSSRNSLKTTAKS